MIYIAIVFIAWAFILFFRYKKPKPNTSLYLLNDTSKPRPAINNKEWAEWRKQSEDDRAVALYQSDSATVSTVFLGVDHNFVSNGEPLLYESILKGELWNDVVLSETKDEAIEVHERMVKTIMQLDSAIKLLENGDNDEWICS